MQVFKVDKETFWYELTETENYFTLDEHSAEPPKFGTRYFVALRTKGQTKGMKVFIKLFRDLDNVVDMKFNDFKFTIWSNEIVMFHFNGTEWERIF